LTGSTAIAFFGIGSVTIRMSCSLGTSSAATSSDPYLTRLILFIREAMGLFKNQNNTKINTTHRRVGNVATKKLETSVYPSMIEPYSSPWTLSMVNFSRVKVH
jgi:hypothetical protein